MCRQPGKTHVLKCVIILRLKNVSVVLTGMCEKVNIICSSIFEPFKNEAVNYFSDIFFFVGIWANGQETLLITTVVLVWVQFV